jgi:integrase
LINGQLVGPVRAPLLEDVISEYISHLQGLGRSPKTITKDQYCFALVQELAARRGIKRINQIDLGFVDAYRGERMKSKHNDQKQSPTNGRPAQRAKPKTTHTDVVVIKQLLNFAERRRLIAENPLSGLKLEKPKRTPQPCWSRDDVEKILRTSNSNYRPLFSFLADTGARIGEAVWLTWADVDFENQVIRIRGIDDWRPKSGDERAIPMSGELCKLLRELPRSANWVFIARPSAGRSVAGRQVSDRRALSHLKIVLRKLGLPGHLHTFRHSFISHALTHGVPESIVRDWVGHVDQEILRVYTHIADRDSKSAMSGLFPVEAGDAAGN